jgi:hypothetical protein
VLRRVRRGEERECFVHLVTEKTGHGVRWVLVMSEKEAARWRERQNSRPSVGSGQAFSQDGPDAVQPEFGRAAFGFPVRVRSAGTASPGSLDCAESSLQDDPASFELTNARTENKVTKYGLVIPWLAAVAEENWWERLRHDPKSSGEISQAAFLLKARQMGFGVAVPWGDSEAKDFIVWAQDAGDPADEDTRGTPRATLLRVQVKGTGRLHRRGYEIQPVRSTRSRGKKRYTKKDIDVLVAHVQPVDAWYLIPIEKVGRAKSLRFYPGIESRHPKWEQWLDRWDVLK